RSVVEPRVRRLFFDEAILSADVVGLGTTFGPTAFGLLLTLAAFFLHPGHVAQPLVVVALATAAAAAHRQGDEEGARHDAYRNHRALQRDCSEMSRDTLLLTEADSPVDFGESGTLVMAGDELLVGVVAAPPGLRAVVT
ncbi:unnamed protein product, partial [Ixodes pacificus]